MEKLAKEYPQISDLLIQFWVHLVVLVSVGFFGRKRIKALIGWPLRALGKKMTRDIRDKMDTQHLNCQRLHTELEKCKKEIEDLQMRDARRILNIEALRREIQVVTQFVINGDQASNDLIIDQSYDSESGNSGTLQILKGRPALEAKKSRVIHASEVPISPTNTPTPSNPQKPARVRSRSNV